MKTRLLNFIDALRAEELSVSVGEALDAMQAVSVIGIERAAFREALAAVLIKDEADRPTFERVFARFFPTPGRQRRTARLPQSSEAAAGRGTRGPGERHLPVHEPHDTPRPGERERPHERERRPSSRPQEHRAERLARERRLQQTPFAVLSGQDIEECSVLARELAQRFHAHLARRSAAERRGRVDMRRTLRRAIATGGVPMQLALRHRNPGRPDLVALCDLSHSVATASRFLLALLTPAHHFFRRVHLFAFVDRPVEVSIEADQLVPHDHLDLHARSDFGRVLVDFLTRHEALLNRNTLLLVLGDARNNRRPPRADILARMRTGLRHVVWLNPEAPQRWNTGDSVMALYARCCDTVVAADTPRALYVALRRTLRNA